VGDDVETVNLLTLEMMLNRSQLRGSVPIPQTARSGSSSARGSP